MDKEGRPRSPLSPRIVQHNAISIEDAIPNRRASKASSDSDASEASLPAMPARLPPHLLSPSTPMTTTSSRFALPSHPRPPPVSYFPRSPTTTQHAALPLHLFPPTRSHGEPYRHHRHPWGAPSGFKLQLHSPTGPSAGPLHDSHLQRGRSAEWPPLHHPPRPPFALSVAARPFFHVSFAADPPEPVHCLLSPCLAVAHDQPAARLAAMGRWWRGEAPSCEMHPAMPRLFSAYLSPGLGPPSDDGDSETDDTWLGGGDARGRKQRRRDRQRANRRLGRTVGGSPAAGDYPASSAEAAAVDDVIDIVEAL